MDERLLDSVIARTRIIDTHEHILPRADLGQDLNLMTLLGRAYLMSDLISAGMPPEAWGKGSDSWRRAEYAPAEQIWGAMQPFLPAVKDSGFYAIWQTISLGARTATLWRRRTARPSSSGAFSRRR